MIKRFFVENGQIEQDQMDDVLSFHGHSPQKFIRVAIAFRTDEYVKSLQKKITGKSYPLEENIRTEGRATYLSPQKSGC